ncbi:double-stranded RNA-binding protein Staufen homolog 2-like isoform X2 [Centruroides vittatus]|uniref:double-stranded RNA-binding protein Staufen homolog 2-like isoform X2 n=1 Tax=Centruroides vittatus TaxID=120091 RepID=UPI00350EC348
MNPNTMTTALLPPQSISKNPGSSMIVGVTLPQAGATGPTSTMPTPGHVPGHAPSVGGMGDCTLTLQGPPLSGVPGSGLSATITPQNQTPNSGTAPSSTAPSAGGGSNQSTVTVANTKEKTPMCLINELARYNKVQHQYHLVDESGPPHKKTFTVVLKLDKEEYTASGPSIKKAQHAAADIALEQTALKHPPPKNQRKALDPITPTVELNALAMKRGEPAVYQVIEPQRPQYIPSLNFRGMYHQRYHYPKLPPTYYVSLKVGNRQFFGKGHTSQAARHAAAEEALRILRSLPLPDHVKKRNETIKTNGDTPEIDASADLKSPISLVHEIALKRVLPVNFEVIRESGPPHMRTFITRCTVGDIITEGEGNGKKVSKKRAAERMLEELKKLPPLPPAQQKVKKKPVMKKKNRNLIKEQKADPQYGQGINPISRLIQIQQAKKEREPIYTVIAERGEPRQREFIMQCSLGELSTNGTGSNKKTAKRNAAESMLQLMGYSRPQPGKPAIKSSGLDGCHVLQGQESEKGRKVTFLDHEGEKLDGEGKLGRQLVPGLLLMPDTTGLTTDQSGVQGFTSVAGTGSNRAPGGPIQKQEVVNKIIMQTTSTIAKELLDTGVSPTAEAIRKSGHKPLTPQAPVRPKQQLMYLADVLGFQVHFTDFPKGNKLEYLSLVSLSTIPPQVKHGAGPTIEASHDQAALMALRALAELGLESLTDGNKKEIGPPGMGAGDGIYLTGVQGTAPKLANSPTSDLGSNPNSGATVPITAKGTH